MNTRWGESSWRASAVGRCSNPPSSATSRGRSASRCSSLVVSGSSLLSGGLPGLVDAGRMNPRAPRRGVLGDLADLNHVAELVGLAELALADRTGIGIEH